MTEVKLRHLLFFIILFILTWFLNWIALVFFALIIISIIGTLYSSHKYVSYEKCYYYEDHTGVCHFTAYGGLCTGKCEKFVIIKK